MELLAQFAFNGLVVGSLYAMLGVSLALIYWTSKIFHFAHGIVYAAAGYVVYVCVVRLETPTAVGIAVAGLAAALLGMGCERLIYRPLRRRNSPPMVSLVASLGFFVVVQNLFVILFTADPRPLTQEYFQPLAIGPITTTWLKIATILTGAAVVLVAIGFLYRTRPGRAIRAVVDNPNMAAVVGIDLDRTYLLTYAVGSALVVPAAYLVTLDRGASPDMGLPALLAAAISVFVGGVGAIPAAAVAGLLLGLAENLGLVRAGAEWQSTISFLILIVFLLVRPSGIFGGRVRRVQV